LISCVAACGGGGGVEGGQDLAIGCFDVDCGGSCAPCPDGRMCLHASDCMSAVCTNNVCVGGTDQSSPADLSSLADLSSPADLSGPVDLFTPPDLSPPLDLVPGPDLLMPCPVRPDGEWHVAPSGSDSPSLYAGNGSAQCPLKTIGNALTRELNDGFTPVTLFVHAAPGITPTVYGDNCTGGAPCDTALSLFMLSGQSLTLQGDGAGSVTFATAHVNGNSSAIATAGGSMATPANVTIAGLTVESLLLGVIGQNQGTSIGAATAGYPVTIRDCVVKGVPATATTAGVDFCIVGSSFVTVGPGVTIDGCQEGVGGVGTITGTVADPTVIKNSSDACVTSATTVSGTVTATGCVKYGVLANNIDGLIVSGGGNGLGEAVRAGTVQNTQVIGFAGVGIDAGNIGPNVQVMNTVGSGVRVVSGSTINGLVSTMNQGDGVLCDGAGTLSVTNAVLTGNGGSGLVATGNCNVTQISMTTFNRTSAKNGVAGLCLLGGATTSVSAGSSTFGCGYSGSGCVTTSSPTTATGATCQIADVSAASGVTVATPSPTCCN
jgi:hypothetical protein